MKLVVNFLSMEDSVPTSFVYEGTDLTSILVKIEQVHGYGNICRGLKDGDIITINDKDILSAIRESNGDGADFIHSIIDEQGIELFKEDVAESEGKTITVKPEFWKEMC